MKHVINILVILILTGFAVGIAYLQMNDVKSAWFIAYLPISIFMFLWGLKLNDNYK